MSRREVDSINLGEECGPLPGGGELASGEYHGNLVLTVIGSLSWTEGMAWAVRVEKPTVTASGRKGKPRSVLLLRANPDETVPDLLRHIASMWEMGEIVPGESYPAPADAMGALRRVCSPILLARRLHEAPMFDGEFFRDGFPEDEREALRSAVGEEEWAALTSMRLEAGRTGVLVADAEGTRGE